MKNDNKEAIVHFGVEGGGMELFGLRDTAGQWEFWQEGTSMDLDENDDEVWRNWKTDSVKTWDEALASLPKDWLCMHPLEVHPDFKDAFRIAIEKALPALREDLLPYCLERILPRWDSHGVRVVVPEELKKRTQENL